MGVEYGDSVQYINDVNKLAVGDATDALYDAISA